MSASETIREASRLIATNPASEELIELLAEKLRLAETQIAALEKERSQLAAENGNLTTEIKRLKGNLEALHPGDELEAGAKTILKFFFNSGGRLTPQQISNPLHLDQGKTESLLDSLRKRNLVTMVPTEDPQTSEGGGFQITSSGRAYVMTNLMKKA